jgi:hypothetical protein
MEAQKDGPNALALRGGMCLDRIEITHRGKCDARQVMPCRKVVLGKEAAADNPDSQSWR